MVGIVVVDSVVVGGVVVVESTVLSPQAGSPKTKVPASKAVATLLGNALATVPTIFVKTPSGLILVLLHFLKTMTHLHGLY